VRIPTTGIWTYTWGCKICRISWVYYQCRPRMERSHKEHLQQGQQNYRIPETKLGFPIEIFYHGADGWCVVMTVGHISRRSLLYHF
jgi:hypothetical protein